MCRVSFETNGFLSAIGHLVQDLSVFYKSCVVIGLWEFPLWWAGAEDMNRDIPYTRPVGSFLSRRGGGGLSKVRQLLANKIEA